jgi:hypothetical protein
MIPPPAMAQMIPHELIDKIVSWGGVALFALLGGVVSFYLKSLIDKIERLSVSFENMRVELARDYVRREELCDNDLAHKELRIDISKHGERVAILEAIVASQATRSNHV